MKRSIIGIIYLSVLLFLVFSLSSCSILGFSDEDDCNCTSVVYNFSQTGPFRQINSIECDDNLISLSKEDGSTIRWTIENGLRVQSDAINCNDSDEPQIVDTNLIRYKNLFWEINCSEGVSGFRNKITKTIGGVKTTACFDITCGRGLIPLTSGGRSWENYIKSVKLCN